MSRRGRHASTGPDGLILIDKPIGPTSFDVIRQLRRITGIRKFGHAGTLDPMASGMLPVLVNRGTRLVPWLMDGTKRYDAEVLLGVATDTCDAMGEVIATSTIEHIDAERVRSALAELVGQIEQIPPKHSAIRVGGKRAYELARSGEDFEMKSRIVEIHGIEDVEIELPHVRFAVDCGKGTYIRSLAVQLAEKLGTHGHLTALRRTRVGSFGIEDAVGLAELDAEGPEAFHRHLVALFQALEGAADTLTIAPERVDDLVHGRTRFLADIEPGRYRVHAEDALELLAIVERVGQAKPTVKVFAASSD